MKVAFLVSEVEPFAKTGGLGDIAAALPKALARRGHDVRIFLPLYREVDRVRWGLRETKASVAVQVGATTLRGRLWQAPVPLPAASASLRPPAAGRFPDAAAGMANSPVTTYLVECDPLFHRDGLYQHHGQDHADNLQRFSFFSQAVLRLLPVLGWQPEVVHCHEWQTALACAHLAWTPLGREPFFASMGTVFTIHNIAYQGLFPKAQWPLTGLPARAFSVDGLEYYHQVNCLKGGLIASTLLTTVSPTYAREIHTEEFGRGMEGVLAGRGDDLVGILNGIDVEEWNPETDPHLPAHYTADRLAGKSVCKLALQQSQQLPTVHDCLIGMVQRLAEQKGIDIFTRAVEALMRLPLQIVVLGVGDPKYHRQLERLVKQFPERLRVNLTFDSALAHQIEAGADAFLMPAHFEPCGLNQMYSMRYGAVPIVRKVGGLADTVCDVTSETLAAQTATGFVFEAYTARALVEAVTRALAAFHDHNLWTRVMRAGMRTDCSWNRSAQAYVDVYERAVIKGITAR